MLHIYTFPDVHIGEHVSDGVNGDNGRLDTCFLLLQAKQLRFCNFLQIYRSTLNEDILISARRYLRAWALSTDLAGVPPADPRVQRILGTALPSTHEQNALECHFVESLT